MKYFIVAVCLLILTIISTNYLGNVKDVLPLQPLDTFPTQLGSFVQVGKDQIFGDDVMAVLGVDHYIMRQYHDRNGYGLGLYIGFYESQKEGEIIHSPKHCMPGGGWNIIESSEVMVKGGQGELLINKMILSKGEEKQMAHYWYQGRGRVIANEYKDRAWMIYDSITRQRSDGALVRITGPGENLELDEKEQREFLKKVLEVIPDYLPD